MMKKLLLSCFALCAFAAFAELPKPFLVALTDRTPSEALSALHIFSGPSVVFSSRITSAQRAGHSDFPIALPKRNRAGLLITGVLLALLASLAACRKGSSPSSEREPMNSSSNVENPSATNSVHSVTNSMVSPEEENFAIPSKYFGT